MKTRSFSPNLSAWPAAVGALQVAQRLREAGHKAYWAGGCVRDLLLGRPPKDFDIATNARPDDVLRLFPTAHAVGKSFGVVRVPIETVEYEVATFRTDLDYRDGRRPTEVLFTNEAEDAARRDFTVNALFFDPLNRVVLDYAGGLDDLAARLIRAVGEPDRRFAEDRLRLLRAVRFSATLDFAIEPATTEAIRRHANRITEISAERVREELTRLLLEAARPGDALELLQTMGLLDPLLPEVAALRGQEQPPEFHPEGDVFRHTVLMLNAMEHRSLRLAFAALLHDVGKPPTARRVAGRLRFERHAETGAAMAQAVMERLRFPRDDQEAVVHMVRNHMRFSDVRRMRRATLRRMVGAPTFPEELELHRLDCLASHGSLEHYEFLQAFQRELAAESPLPKPWIRGEDIMALGIPSGPEVGRWLRQAYDAQLEGRFADRKALLAWLRAKKG